MITDPNLNLAMSQTSPSYSWSWLLRMIIFVCCYGYLSLFSQDIIKKGWNLGVLPAISFDEDLGMQYGGLLNLYHYGDGSRYPAYNHSLYLELSGYTRGSGIYRFAYHSDRLIPKLEFFADLSYIPNQTYNFYGWNGYEAVYNPSWEDRNNPDGEYRTAVFYRYRNNMFRCKGFLQGQINRDFSWLASLIYYDFRISSVDIDRLNKGKPSDKQLPPLSEQPTLFDLYKQWGLISPEEAEGGSLMLLSGGVVYDTRDNRPNPMKGMWSELIFEGNPAFVGSFQKPYLKLSVIQRQYFTLIPEDLSLAVRLAAQLNVAGKAPFWMQPMMITSVIRASSEEGLGGIRNLRGIPRQRVVGNGVAYGNAELRWKFLYTRFLNQNFYFGLNLFGDAGQVVQKMDIEDKVKALQLTNEKDYFDFGSERLHFCYGLGLRIAMNRNFIVAADYGRAVDKRDGKGGLYIGLNYLF